MRVTVAGATGFIGKNLLEKLETKFFLRGLTRSQRENENKVEWVSTDFFLTKVL